MNHQSIFSIIENLHDMIATGSLQHIDDMKFYMVIRYSLCSVMI